MKEITNLMYYEYEMNRLKYDFMGYTFVKKDELSYHHMIVPKRCGGKETKENGAILVQKTSHDYLHRIENVDPEIFLRITEYMIEENERGRIDIQHLRKIRDLLLYFERDHIGEVTSKGKILIKEEYVKRRIKL